MNYLADNQMIPLEPNNSWVTRNGEVILIELMEDTHIINTIKFLRKRCNYYRMRDLKRMSRYIADAPDGAADACNAEADQIIKMSDDEYLKFKIPSFTKMLEVAKSRRLEI